MGSGVVMRISQENHVVIRVASILLATLLLGACSNKFTDMFSGTPNLSLDLNAAGSPAPVVPAATRITVTAADFANADGSCTPSPGSASAETTAIALQMPECGLVQVLGPPEKIDIGANERGDRQAVMFYGQGERPGRYSFTGGQLTSIERVAEPPPPPKAKPAKPPVKKPARVAAH
jgi:hypothetical protein